MKITTSTLGTKFLILKYRGSAIFTLPLILPLAYDIEIRTA